MGQINKSLCAQYWDYKTIFIHSEAGIFEERFFLAIVEKSRRNQSTERKDNGYCTCMELQKSRMIN